MRIADAKAIPIADFLARLGSLPTRESQMQSWHLSPLRDEKTASFHVHKGKNVWYDHGEGRGGTVIDLAMVMLESRGAAASVSHALALIEEVMSGVAGIAAMPKRPSKHADAEEGHWIFRDQRPLHHLALLRYLQQRGISLDLAKPYVREVRAEHSVSGDKIFALGMQNEEGGWALRTPFLKACIAPNGGTFIRGADARPEGLHVMEGGFDFLAVLTSQGKLLANDSYVLHSTSNVVTVKPLIYQYGYASLFSWMDNDAAGVKAAAILQDFAAAEPGLKFYRMNKIYEGHKDVALWHEKNPLPKVKVQP